MADLPRRLAAEASGSALLLAIVIGSGIMGERLAGGNVALALLGNTLATGAGLFVLILLFGPLSGAHFNPVVTLAMALQRRLAARDALGYAVAQVNGAVLGVWAAHAMFGEALLQVSAKLREGPAQIFAEAVATFTLLLVILGSQRLRLEGSPPRRPSPIRPSRWRGRSAIPSPASRRPQCRASSPASSPAASPRWRWGAGCSAPADSTPRYFGNAVGILGFRPIFFPKVGFA